MRNARDIVTAMNGLQDHWEGQGFSDDRFNELGVLIAYAEGAVESDAVYGHQGRPIPTLRDDDINLVNDAIATVLIGAAPGGDPIADSLEAAWGRLRAQLEGEKPDDTTRGPSRHSSRTAGSLAIRLC
jgi:hypothetical protein